ncbi:MAG: M23 family metallopeptidase [Bacillota bacterium]|nr:M23 family metallopeptidase [Bacillota bacterium]
MREEEKRTSQSSSFKRFFKKRWVFPALYIASAAIILTGVMWYQSYSNSTDKYDYNSTDLGGKKYNQPAIEVSRSLENFVMPVSKSVSSVVEKPFYDSKAKKEDQEAALLSYDNNKFIPNTGIDLKAKNGETFDVLASMSGTVTKVEEDSFLGNVIEIEHANGVVTQYQSVKDISIKVGDQVDQSQVIAKAGQSLINEKAGVHVHFEIRKDGMPVNPQSFFNKPLSALQTDTKDSKNIDNSSQTSGQQESNMQDNQTGKANGTIPTTNDTNSNTSGKVQNKNVKDSSGNSQDSGTNQQNSKMKPNDSNSKMPSTDSSLNNTNS